MSFEHLRDSRSQRINMVQHIPHEVPAEWEKSLFVALGLQVTLRKFNIILVKQKRLMQQRAQGEHLLNSKGLSKLIFHSYRNQAERRHVRSRQSDKIGVVKAANTGGDRNINII